MSTMLWYDYETHDSDAMCARPASFGAIRTDMQLNPIGTPINIVCRLANDFLPSPGAMLVHRIPVSRLQSEGVPEAEFARVVYAAKNQPDSINTGFNTADFDVKISHNLFYRNLLPMYDWHMNSNTRFDIHDLIRLVSAIDPAALVIPRREDGTPSMRLDDLAKANGIPSGNHDALGDVQVSISLAKKVKAAQPAVWDYALAIRTKQVATKELMKTPGRIFVHAATYYGADSRYVAPVLPIGTVPQEQNNMIVVNLAGAMEQLESLSADELRTLLFTKKADLPAGTVRPPLNQIKVNACPVFLPLEKLPDAYLQRTGIDKALCEANARRILGNPNLRNKFISVFQRETFPSGADVDDQMYGGSFASPSDKREMSRLLQLPPKKVAEDRPKFEADKYRTLHGRYIARNYPELLSPENLARWEAMRLDFIHGRASRKGMTMGRFETELQEARTRAHAQGDHPGLEMLAELERYVAGISQPTQAAV